MGTIRHHTIIVTGFNQDDLADARAKAVELFGSAQANSVTGGHLASITEITKATGNSFASFMIAPDGSNEWWDHSDLADAARREFLTYLNGTRHDDPSLSNSVSWAEVQFGGPNGDDMLLASIDEDAKKLFAAVIRIEHEGHARPEYPAYVGGQFDVLRALEQIGVVFLDTKGNYLLTGIGFQVAGYVARDHPFLKKAVTHNTVSASV